ncbi:hypothetical protein DPMN_043107 [Dreissena polymorpha]|uniref:Uncharacterized protein n=1 Tax=Dreissena polymorpha TaxID=45954 RepID=A0A9D4D254_DREPO|nr:hypothetical protein DPMN_043107 [Dreissena polymorpha]
MCKCYNTATLKYVLNEEEIKSTHSNKFLIIDELLEEEKMKLKWQKVKVGETSACQAVLGPKSPTMRAYQNRRFRKLKKKKDTNALSTAAKHEPQK